MESITDTDRPRTDGFTGDGLTENGLNAKKTMLAGLIGAAVASVGYIIYTRLEDEQKDAVRRTVGRFVEDKVSEVRSQLKL